MCRIYEKYKDYLLTLAGGLLNDRQAAEDVVHDVFVGFAGSAHRFRLTGSLKGYPVTCVTNRVRDTIMARTRKDVSLKTTNSAVSGSVSREQRAIEAESGKGFITMDADNVTDIEQTRSDLEGIELLRQKDKRELLKVEEILSDGAVVWKIHEYKYELSEGRTKDMREAGDGMPVYSQEQFRQFKPKLEEFRRLRKAGQGQELGTYEKTIEGRAFSFKREKYPPSDGTEFIWSVGTPKKEQ
jgi:DNA-directed RNA polymerase specialized sigma24 family protein